MTAEVAILNREAVAIAADSAVTLTGPEGRKIYNTANKLFALSITEPVAVMIYNTASFGPIPWETVVKEFRRRVAMKSYATVEEYAHKFIEHLDSLGDYVSVDEQKMSVALMARWELNKVQAIAKDAVDAAASAGKDLNDEEVSSVILNYIDSRIDELKRIGFVAGISASAAGQQITSVIGDWETFVGQYLVDLPTNSEIVRLARVMVRTSLRVVSPSPWYSGVVVAGFGKSQLFPALSQYVIDGIIAGRVRTRQVDSVQIGDETSAIICPFAQSDMIKTFMNGIHPTYQALEGFVVEMIESLLNYFGNQIKNDLSSESYATILEEIELRRSETIGDFLKLYDNLKKSNYGPIMSVVESLPKEELAEMAEALVSLTSFKRRVSTEVETVGGPVDVAVISKGDGLIWIKRKHYFAPELNPRYFTRDQMPYRRDTQEEGP